MASLYEQIGDLAAVGNAAATTKAYQEALGIQIAHQGTVAKAPTTSMLPVVPDALARALSYLHAANVLELASVSTGWKAVTKLGVVWRKLFNCRWPNSCLS